MSESFLERWARRKREVAQQEAAPEAPKGLEELARDRSERAPAVADSPAAPATEEPAFDPSQLPSIETITAETDIRAFLAPGVPASLRHAALRRAWSADPTIRDFIGLSENAWDFTAPEGVPGFGPIGSPEDVRRLLAQVMGGPENAAEERGDAAREAVQASVPAEESGAAKRGAAAETGTASEGAGQEEEKVLDENSDAGASEMLQHKKEHVALQQEERSPQYMPTPGRRQHGRALPE